MTITLNEPLDFSAVCARLEAGATLVTANNRLARHLALRYAEAQVASGVTAWRTPDILSLEAWQRRGYRFLTETGAVTTRLLSTHQERQIWQRLVRESDLSANLLRPDLAANLAADAWHRLRTWDLTLDDVEPSAGEEVRAFLRWSREFQKLCADKNWIDDSQLPEILTRNIQHLALPTALILAGFEEIHPALRRLIGAFESKDYPVHETAVETRSSSITRTVLKDTQAELQAAASWTVHRLNSNPGARLGVVIPDLSQRRSEVIRIFDALIHLETRVEYGHESQRAYNLSLGQSLSEYPLVHDALLVLKLVSTGLEFDEASTLLRSPFLGGGESGHLARCAVESNVRDRNNKRLYASQLLRLAKHFCPDLSGRLRKATDALETKPASPSTWANRFRNILSALGWPGERSLNSSEYQQAQRFRDLVDELPSLDGLVSEIKATQALGALRDMARQTIFQPESDPGARIEIMGLLEADGQSFDGLWIMGLSDQQYPPPADPHPMLPISLQRKHGMPHGSAELDFEFFLNLLRRLQGSASEILLSWPQRDGERELLPSPLIIDVELEPFDQLAIPLLKPLDEHWLGEQALRLLDDSIGIPLAEKTRVAGGTRLLQDQAACPFRAYARHRLGAASLADPSPEPSPLTRGNLLHSALEHFWQALGSLSALTALTDDQLTQRIEEAIEQALVESRQQLSEKAQSLEHRRLFRRITSWVHIERQRESFAVDATEERIEVEINGLKIDTLADRVDRLDDGRKVVIDYKTGLAKRDGWFGDRLFEPQLPLYAINLKDAQVAAVSFAKLKAGDSGFVGTAENGGLLPGVKAIEKDGQRGEINDWPELLAYWREALELLAKEVRAGLAAVAPQKSDACVYCDLGDLCRIATVSDDLPDNERAAET